MDNKYDAEFLCGFYVGFLMGAMVMCLVWLGTHISVTWSWK